MSPAQPLAASMSRLIVSLLVGHVVLPSSLWPRRLLVDPPSVAFVAEAVRVVRASPFSASTPRGNGPLEPLRDPALYDDLSVAYRAAFANATTPEEQLIRRIGNVDVLSPNDDLGLLSEEDGEVAMCHLTAMWRYSTLEGDLEDPNNENSRSLGPAFYGDSVGGLLAVHHFNHGLGVVADELDGINERCNVRFTAEFFDSYSSIRKTVSQMTDLVKRTLPEAHPCAVLGAFRSAVSTPLSILNGVYDLPQLSPVSSSPDLDNQNLHPLFSRMVPSDAGTSLLYLRFLEGLGVRHVGCLYVNDAYGAGYHRAFKRIAEEQGVEIHCQSINFKPSRQEIGDAIGNLARTDYRYFFSMTFGPEHYDLIMEEAYNFGIAGNPDKVTSWVFAGGNQRWVQNVRYPVGSPLHLATLGTGYIQADGGIEGMEGFDRFMEAWSALDADDVEYFNSKQPPDHITVESDYFKKNLPERETVFAYDAVVALGLAACEVSNASSGEYFTGQQHFDALVNTKFHGATGFVRIDPETTSRDPTSALYVIFNAVARDPDDDGMVSFEVKKSIIHLPGEGSSDGGWVGVDGSPFVWADGGTTPPDSLPLWDHDYNHLGAGLRAFGIVASAIAMGASLGFAAWTWFLRTRRVVRASQPIFLGLICAGTLIMGAAIIPLSFDDGSVNEDGASISCMSAPWLYCCGFVLSLSALFSKTWRVNKILLAPRFRRITVSYHDVLWPLALFMAANVVVLLVWTVHAPLEYTRVDLEGEDSFERTVESYGTCLAGSSYTPYFVTLAVINMCPLLISNYQAYKSRKILTEFNESSYIAVAMASILQAKLIGIPVFAVVADDPQARFLVSTALIFIECMAILLLIFVPKVLAHIDKDGRRGSFVGRSRHGIENGPIHANSGSSIKSDAFFRIDEQRRIVDNSVETVAGKTCDEEDMSGKGIGERSNGDDVGANESKMNGISIRAGKEEQSSNVGGLSSPHSIDTKSEASVTASSSENGNAARMWRRLSLDSYRSDSEYLEGLRFVVEADEIRNLKEIVREKDQTLLKIHAVLMASSGPHVERGALDKIFHGTLRKRRNKNTKHTVSIKPDGTNDEMQDTSHSTGW